MNKLLLIFLVFFIGCVPKFTVIEQKSIHNPGVVYSVGYVKKGTSGVCCIDRYKDGKLISAGNTVTLDGFNFMNLLNLAPKPSLLLNQ